VPLKVLTHPTTGKTYKMGCRRSAAPGLRLRFKNYRLPDMPTPPPTLDYSAAAMASLSDIYGNDDLGDCVIAGILHDVGIVTGNSCGAPLIATMSQAIAFYSAVGGYDPSQVQPDGSNPSDNGCNPEVAMNYWAQTGAPIGSKPSAWMSVAAEHAREALWLFGNLSVAMEMPDEWVSPMPSSSGFVWDVAGDPDQENGHFVVATGYDQATLDIDSWAMLGKMTNAAVAKYASAAGGGGLYVVVDQDIISKATQKAPSGFAFSELEQDFALIRAS
jgi:hypothetical protein